MSAYREDARQEAARSWEAALGRETGGWETGAENVRDRGRPRQTPRFWPDGSGPSRVPGKETKVWFGVRHGQTLAAASSVS